jgi:hypothetical protein
VAKGEILETKVPPNERVKGYSSETVVTAKPETGRFWAGRNCHRPLPAWPS